MQFTIPTTKTQMYSTLQEIFNYYRIRREVYEEPSLSSLALTRIGFTEHDESSLLERAKTLVEPENDKYFNDKKEKYLDEISELENQLVTCQIQKENAIALITERYDLSIEKIELEAIKKGIQDSSIVVDKVTYLENQKNIEQANAISEYENKQAVISSKITALNDKLATLDETKLEMFNKKAQAKLIELKEKQSETVREVHKYNNTVMEKETKYQNYIKEAKASLKLKYLEISSKDFSKEQLVDMGYYSDVIRCVCGYYDTLSALSAYRDIASESKLCIYLEDFYEEVVYMYQTRAMQ